MAAAAAVCSWKRAAMPHVWEQVGKAKGRTVSHPQHTVSTSRLRQSPATRVGKKGTGAKQTTGGVAGKRNPCPKPLKPVIPSHPSGLLCMQLHSCKHGKEQPALRSARIQSMRNTGNKHRSKGNAKLYTQLRPSFPVKERRAQRF